MRVPKVSRATTKDIVWAKTVVKRAGQNGGESSLDVCERAGPMVSLETFGDRLWELCGWEGYDTMDAFSIACGLSHSTLGAAARKNGTTMRVLIAIRRRTQVSLNWLACNDGPPYSDGRDPRRQHEAIERRTDRPVQPLKPIGATRREPPLLPPGPPTKGPKRRRRPTKK
jgi:hypothetical protein